MSRMSATVAAVLALTTLTTQAATLRVPQQYRTIQAAVDAASPSDTVSVGPGRYIENVVIRKSLTLKSTFGAALTIIDGHAIGTPLAVWGTSSESVTIAGFTLTGGAFLLDGPLLEYPSQWGAGLHIDGAAMALVHDNIITGNRGCGASGIRAFESSVRIRDNLVRANEPMDWCPANGDAVSVMGNNAYDKTAIVERNRISSNGGIGLNIGFLESAAVRGNTVTDNGMGLENMPGAGGIAAAYMNGVISNNYVAKNVAYASPAISVVMGAEPAQHLSITANVFIDNESHSTVGVSYLVASEPATLEFRGNLIVADSPGVLIYCDGSGSTVEGNVFFNRNSAGIDTFCNH